MPKRAPATIAPFAVAASLAFAALAAGAAAAGADTLLTLKAHTDAFQIMGQRKEARDVDVKMWIGDQRVRRDDGPTTTILRLDRNKMYIVDHDAKSYNTLDLPVDFRKLLPEGGEQLMEQMAKMAKMDVTVQQTDERKKIGSWNVRRVEVGMSNPMGMRVATTMWVSDEVGVDHKAFTRMQANLAALKPGSMDWVKKLEEIGGFPVLQESKITAMGAEFASREELVAVDQKPAPEGTYEPPAGFKEQPFNPMAPPRQ